MIRRLTASALAVSLSFMPANAFWQSRDSNYNQNVVSGGGGGPAWTPTSGGYVGSRFGTTATITGQTFGVGLEVVGISDDNQTDLSTASTVTIDGVLGQLL